ncbi:MAG: DinB family protein [Chloroflexi bacterium]|nr:DinB family protein [Chloroflexota bacterium]MDA1226539.1 DinB family protein [Chloroflexota bacterium]
MALKEFIEKSMHQYHSSHLDTLNGLSAEELAYRPGPDSMSIGFIAWHCARVHDFLVQTIMKQTDEIWSTNGWAEKFGRAPANPQDRGFGFSVEQVAAFQVPPLTPLLEYAEAVRANAVGFLETLSDQELQDTWVDSPAGGRFTLASVYQQIIGEMNQHGGQMAYVRGLQRGIEDPMKRSTVWEEAKTA